MARSIPIAGHALLADGHGAALVADDGAVAWWCGPRIDGPSCFSRLLDPEAGHCRIAPEEPCSVERTYRAGTLVLETTMRTATGAIRVTDALVQTPGAPLGHDVPGALVRLVEGLDGEVAVAVDVVPRPEYGLAVPRVVATDGGVASIGGPERVFAHAPTLAWHLAATSASARRVVRQGERFGLVLRRTSGLCSQPPEPLDPAAALAATTEAWRAWLADHDGFDGPYADAVHRSMIVLKGLTYAPTGAVVAAATTSLPERLGHDTGWDYRYGWLRDASLVARALEQNHAEDEAQRYFRWMMRAAVACEQDDHVQIVFGVEGERQLTESRLEHLAGFAGQPVRLGNGAWEQTQLDALGELLGVAARVQAKGMVFEPFERASLAELADRAANDWTRPDAGIWEAREAPRHHTFSKIMCWVALDRAVTLAGRGALGADALPARVAAWRRERDRVHAAVLDHAWDGARERFADALDDDGGGLDTAVLLMPSVGFLPADDPRLRATVAAVEAELGDGSGLVRRSSLQDPDDTAFLICTGWLADCHARAGDTATARERLDALLRCANDVGLLAERATFGAYEPMGNLPQALSHVGVINGAGVIAAAEAGELDPAAATVGRPG
jgi:alpha,alpha-trehalase